MDKIDYKKELKHLYAPPVKNAIIVDVPPMNYLMIDGKGDPVTSQDYMDTFGALYSVAYTIKFMLKRQGTDYGVLPLEGLWWAEDMTAFTREDRAAWQWTSIIMQPEPVTRDIFEKAMQEVLKKKKLPALSKMRFENLNEGKSAQIMHIGPYAAEAPTIEKLHLFIKEQGYQLTGKHHEIYLGDPSRTAPEKLKTIVRQPFK
jgi:hypothetical protein